MPQNFHGLVSARLHALISLSGTHPSVLSERMGRRHGWLNRKLTPKSAEKRPLTTREVDEILTALEIADPSVLFQPVIGPADLVALRWVASIAEAPSYLEARQRCTSPVLQRLYQQQYVAQGDDGCMRITPSGRALLVDDVHAAALAQIDQLQAAPAAKEA